MSLLDRILKNNPNHDQLGRFATVGGVAIPNLTLTKVSGQQGSNDGGIFKDGDGVQSYVKFYKNPEQGRTEVLAAKILNELTVRTKNPYLATVNGKEAVVSAWNEDLTKMTPADFQKLGPIQKIQAAKMYIGAIITKNWDIVGLDHDNILKSKASGNLYHVDPGGSFEFRAQGGPKDYGPDTAEYMSLRNPANPSGKVFNTVFAQNPEVEHTALVALKALDMNKIHGIFKTSGVTNQKALWTAFKERVLTLLEREGL
jgi:hypothetical protein